MHSANNYLHNNASDDDDEDDEDLMMYGGADNEYICNPIFHLKQYYKEFHDLMDKMCWLDQFKELMSHAKRGPNPHIVSKLTNGVKGMALFEHSDADHDHPKSKSKYPAGFTFVVPEDMKQWLNTQGTNEDKYKLTDSVKKHIFYVSFALMSASVPVYAINGENKLVKIIKSGDSCEIFYLEFDK